MASEKTSIYQVFLRNFTREGTFQAALPYLETIKAMGFEWVYLTPLHPIGKKARKGTLGSPYAIQNYREINPELGTLADFRRFVKHAHDLGLKVMIDVVYNHTAPDAVLAQAHPEWYLRDSKGNFARKFDDWSDVIDFDFSSSPALWEELVDTLIQWRDEGVDGFRCDVASLVPLEFWNYARTKVNGVKGDGKETYPVVWLAEQVHPGFLLHVREKGYRCHSGPELHQAFDLTYDYDGFERLEAYWAGKKTLEFFVDYLYTQQTTYPEGTTKVRFLENHDQKRAAWRFTDLDQLRQWTVFYQLLSGVTFVYMGQEYAIGSTPSLFEKSSLEDEPKNTSFASWFCQCFSLTQMIKAQAGKFSIKLLRQGVVWIERSGVSRYVALLNLENKRGEVELPFPLQGRDCFTDRTVSLSGCVEIPSEPFVVEMRENVTPTIKADK